MIGQEMLKNFYYTICAAYQSTDLVYGYEGANECVCMVGIINILFIDLSRGILVCDCEKICTDYSSPFSLSSEKGSLWDTKVMV